MQIRNMHGIGAFILHAAVLEAGCGCELQRRHRVCERLTCSCMDKMFHDGHARARVDADHNAWVRHERARRRGHENQMQRLIELRTCRDLDEQAVLHERQIERCKCVCLCKRWGEQLCCKGGLRFHELGEGGEADSC